MAVVSDVIVAPLGEEWTVRHPRRLHERFATRGEARRAAESHVRQLGRDGEPCAVREARSFAPMRTPRERAPFGRA